MSDPDPNQLWSDFLLAWSPERVRHMTIQEYTNLDKKDAFVYWLESRLDKLGSIWGGSAFKFGIYHRDDTEKKNPRGGHIWGDTYAWLSRFGQTPEAAFATIHERLIDVIEAARSGNFERIDEIDLAPMLKWKVAFLYQDRDNPGVFPIFKKDALFHHYKAIDPTAKKQITPYSLMYATLLEKDDKPGDPIEVATTLWTQWKENESTGARAWALPIAWLGEKTVETLSAKSSVGPDDIDDFLENILDGADDLSEGDYIVLLSNETVRAVGTLTSVGPGQYAWRQSPVNFPSGLLVNPTSDVKELSATEWQKIHSRVPKTKSEGLSPLTKETELDKVEPPPSHTVPCIPRNIILYGPPGTGKTYSSKRRALELILGDSVIADKSDEAIQKLFTQKVTEGQIEFVTFHQAYGYEEFVEGLRPVLESSDGSQVHYELHAGVFKRIALRAAAEGLGASSETFEFDDLWQRLLDELKDAGDKVAKGPSGKTYLLKPSIHGNIATYQCEVDEEGAPVNITDKRQLASKRFSKLLWEKRTSFGVSPENLTYQKALDIFQVGNHYTALWIVYNQLLGLTRTTSADIDSFTDKSLRVQQALNKPTTGRASFDFSSQSRQYVLIIDEINRGNISKILGELITLLEPDKRLGASSELKLPLSYSPTFRFAVPPNLHVIGTMNTADRSIALMDVALRRRFTFEELMPNRTIVREHLRKRLGRENAFIELVADLFDTLNNRIRFLYDRDHQLGHSYFLDADNIEALRMVFINRVIPLLQEYFYGSWDKICIVLGCPYDETGRPRRSGSVLVTAGDAYLAPIVVAKRFQENETLSFDHDGYEDQVDFFLRPEFQSGELSKEDLTWTFLNILDAKSGSLKTRFDQLVSETPTEEDGER
jgi:5-methylcytosine-specific restriction enzyme B